MTFGAAFDAFLDPGPFDAVIAGADEPAMFLYTSGSTGTPKGVVLSHQSHIWVVETRLGARARPPPLSDRRAALSHERAGAGKARLRGACHHRAAAAIFRARLYRGDRALSLHLAHRGAADDRHDAARDGDCSRAPISPASNSCAWARRRSAPSLMAALHDALPHAAVTNAYGTTEAGPVVFGPHPQRSAAARALGRLSASQGCAAPRRRRQPRRRRRACWK